MHEFSLHINLIFCNCKSTTNTVTPAHFTSTIFTTLFHSTDSQPIYNSKGDIMPRKPRQKSTLNTYHVVIRGADRQIMFENPSDYRKYLQFLELYKEQLHFKIYAYCLMSNHVHLLIHTPTTSIESIFRHINTAYAVWFNMKYTRTGHLQQGRYYNEPIEDISYLLNVVRYIHQNPQKAQLESSIGKTYPWNSFHDYQTLKPVLTDIFYILDIFGGIENFTSFHQIESSNSHLDIHTVRHRLPDDVAKEIIYEISRCANSTEFQKLSICNRNKAITDLKRKGLSIRQINRLTGIPKGVIENILNKHKNIKN